MKVVRWTGAYGRADSLSDALAFELQRPRTDECAAEPLRKDREGNLYSEIEHVRVGLLVKSRAIIRVFRGDCWSVTKDDRLRKTRRPYRSGHGEAWVHPHYAAIVVKASTLRVFRPSVREAIVRVARLYKLPVLSLRHGELRRIA